MSKNTPRKITHLSLYKKSRVAIVTSRFNETITAELRSGAMDELKKMGARDRQVIDVSVPGAYEIPLAAKWLLTKNKCDGVIALGAVIRGETAHFDYVCSAVERGCTLLQIEQNKPVVFGVLTVDTEDQARERIGGRHGHKGREAAQTLVEMLMLKKQLNGGKKND